MHGHGAQLRQEDRRSASAVRGLGTLDAPPPRFVLLDALTADRLAWLPEIGVGFYPVSCGAEPYDAAYFAKYQRYAATPLGRALTAQRLAFVDNHWRGELVDVGIGCGAFIEARADTLGYDVCPQAIAWLRQRHLFYDIRARSIAAASFWDSLEHIPDFDAILASVEAWAFVSLPIFRGGDHARASKHFRRDEHCWYFEERGLLTVMERLGFACVDRSDIETRLGREDILTYAFVRDGASPL